MLAKSLQLIEASVFSVIFATSIIWIMLFGTIIFNEAMHLLHLLGAVLIFISIMLLVERKGKFRFDSGVLYGLLSAFLLGLALIGWVYVGRVSEPVSWNAICFIGPAILIAALYPKSVSKIKIFTSRQKIWWLVLACLTFAVSTLTLLYAYKHGTVSQIAPLQQTTIIVTVIMAVIFLKETKNLLHKIISAAVCFVGVLLIVS